MKHQLSKVHKIKETIGLSMGSTSAFSSRNGGLVR